MSFLTPLFLLGGLAIAAPIIYHLVRRTTRDRTLFSSLMFLQPSPPQISKKHRVEHWLLLLLRCLALALLALGFARPFFRQAPITDPTAAQPKRIVVLVDQSASMRRLGVWASARERVDTVLRRAGPADQVAVYLFDRQANAMVSFEDWNRTPPADRAAFAAARLAAVTPSWGGTQLGSALISAAEALAETDSKAASGPRQIILVSDLQAGSRLDTLQAYEWPKGVDLLVEPARATNPTNAGVQLVADSNETNRPIDAPVRVRVTNAADSKREQFKLGWTRPAAAAGAAAEFLAPPLDAYVPPGQSRIFSVPVPKGVAGLEQISLQGDDESFDNVVHVIPAAQQRTSVMWIGGDVAEDMKQPLFFLRRAFAETPRVAVQVAAVAPGGPLAPNDVAAAKIIFVSENVPAGTAAALRTEAEQGRTIVVVPRSPAAAPTLAALAGRESLAMEEARPSNYAMLSEIDFKHPLFGAFADPRFSDFTKIHIWKYRKLDPGALPNARVVAKFDSGDPAIIDFPVAKGRVFVLLTGWHPDDSQLAVSTKFVPLMWSLLELSGGVANVTTQYSVGDRIALPAGLNATAMRGPGGASAPLAENAGDFAATLQPGIYETVVAAGAKPQRFAVNLDANESRTSPLGLDELEQLGVPVTRTTTETAQVTENKTQLQGVEAESRQKLWRWFIAATLAVLLVESALAGWASRRSGLRTQEVAS